MVKYNLILLIMVLFVGCKNSNSWVGKYTTFLPDQEERSRLKAAHNASIAPMWVMMMYLRNDNTFVMGSCDLQIWETGNYFLKNDSIVFDNIYSFREGAKIEDRVSFYDKKNRYIQYRYPNKDAKSNLAYPEAIAILKQDFKKSHYGFLRNEEMPLDSLLKVNIFLPLKEQNIWVKKKLQKVKMAI